MSRMNNYFSAARQFSLVYLLFAVLLPSAGFAQESNVVITLDMRKVNPAVLSEELRAEGYEVRGFSSSGWLTDVFLEVPPEKVIETKHRYYSDRRFLSVTDGYEYDRTRAAFDPVRDAQLGPNDTLKVLAMEYGEFNRVRTELDSRGFEMVGMRGSGRYTLVVVRVPNESRHLFNSLFFFDKRVIGNISDHWSISRPRPGMEFAGIACKFLLGR